MNQISTKEAVVRLLWEHRGEWVNSHDLVQKHIAGKFTGIAPMERAYDIVNKDGGIFKSNNFIYYIKHRAPKQNGNQTRYAQFTCTKRERPEYSMGLKDYTNEPLQQLHYSV